MRTPRDLLNRWKLRGVRTFDGLTAHVRDDLVRHAQTAILSDADRTRVEALIALTYHGVLPLDSQCAGPILAYETGGNHDAYLLFLVDDITKDWLETVLWNNAPGFRTHGVISMTDPGGSVPVTYRADGTTVRAAIKLTEAQLRERFPVRPAVAYELHRRWQVFVQLSHDDPADLFAALNKAATEALDAREISYRCSVS